MGDISRLVKVMEDNKCLVCEADLTLVEVNGETEFVEEHKPKPEHKVTSRVWERGVTEIGEFIYKCPAGHTIGVFLTFGGDWTL